MCFLELKCLINLSLHIFDLIFNDFIQYTENQLSFRGLQASSLAIHADSKRLLFDTLRIFQWYEVSGKNV